MKVEKLNTMTGGWFIGDFMPTLLPTQNVEVAVKKYNAGQYENKHFHKIAKEFTVIITGVVEILGQKCNAKSLQGNLTTTQCRTSPAPHQPHFAGKSACR